MADGFIPDATVSEISMNEKRQQAPDDQRRDALLLKLLKTPPQPRPKRVRTKPKPDAGGVESARR
jgi:hypothetical protein